VVPVNDVAVYPTLTPGDWSTVSVPRGSLGVVLESHHERSTRRTFLRVLFPQGVGWLNSAFVRPP
jgi:hypothetical protein